MQAVGGTSARAAEMSPIKLVTFDLDDTLWPQAPVIQRANQAMEICLRDAGAANATADDVVQRMRAIRRERSELAKARGEAPYQISYTDLRKEGIAATLSAAAGLLPSEARAVSESVFDSWLAGRHQAAEDLLFEGAVEAIAAIRVAYPGTLLGAITNSRANPFKMPSLSPLFDFTVSGEEANVFPHRKPSTVIFDVAVQRAAAISSSTAASFTGDDADGSPVWVHVGDDLPNDVGASAAAGATAVWVASESVEDAARAAGSQAEAPPSYSTMTSAEAQERALKRAQALCRVSARICGVQELPALLRSWVQ